MTSDTDDAALFRALRRTWENIDPMPVDLVDRMVAAVATADVSHEYALLTLVEGEVRSAVRSDADMLTLQFSDGRTNVLIHVTPTASGRSRVDGWVDGAAVSVELIQDAGTVTTEITDGRFAFDDVAGGVSSLRIALQAAPEPGGSAELHTPRFEL